MRAQRLGQAGQIVLLARGAEHLVHGRDHHDVADAIGRKLEALAGLRGADRHIDALDGFQPRDGRLDVRVRQIDRRPRPERAVMHHVRIGDRQDDARRALAEPLVGQRLQVDDVRLLVRQMLVVHAVIGGEHQHGAGRVELADIAVHHRVERIREVRAGRRLVLHVVGGREIHQVGALALEDRDAGRHDEFGQVGRIDLGQRLADARQQVADAVVLHRRLVGLLGRERDGAAGGHVEVLAEHRAQLVLGGDDRDLGAGVVERLHDGRRAQEARVVHHHFLARRAVVEVVAGNAVHRRRTAGDDRHVVRVGEARHRGERGEVRAVLHQPREIRREAGLDRALDVARLRAVEADDHRRRLREAIVAAVDRDGRRALDVHDLCRLRGLERCDAHLVQDIADRRERATHVIGIEPPDAADAETVRHRQLARIDDVAALLQAS